MIVLPFSPFQITSYFWKCSAKSPVAITSSPFTTTPVSAVLLVQPTPPPWSAPHPQMSSRIVWSAFTSSAVVTLPRCGPPIRKKTSLSVVGSAALLASCGPPCFVPTRRSAGELTGPASKTRPEISTPCGFSTVIGTTPFCASIVAIPSPRTIVSGRFTRIVWLTGYTPGVRMRFFPCARASLITSTLSDGFATKNFEIGIECPAVGPFAQVVPVPFVCTSGTNTLQSSFASTVRYGASRDTGFVSRVVYGGLGNHRAGAPPTPAKTWFQTPFVHRSTSLFRTRNCCCDPFRTTLSLNFESDAKPPLANDGGVQ